MILNKLIKASQNILGQSAKATDTQAEKINSDSDVTQDMRQKEKYVYGEDRITQQKLYEKWAVKTSWHLKSEGIPLLLSIDPEKYSDSDFDEDTEKKYQGLWEHAQHCVEQGLLSVINKESPVDEWEAKPIDVYQWAAISRVELPEQLTILMEFVMMSLLSTVNVSSDTADGKSRSEASYHKGKERILGSALAMLATYPEQCMNKKGRVRAENIVSLINENETKLFEEEIPDLSSTAAADLINKWLRIIS